MSDGKLIILDCAMRMHCMKTPEKESQELAYKNKTPRSSRTKELGGGGVLVYLFAF